MHLSLENAPNLRHGSNQTRDQKHHQMYQNKTLLMIQRIVNLCPVHLKVRRSLLERTGALQEHGW